MPGPSAQSIADATARQVAAREAIKAAAAKLAAEREAKNAR
jgi:hypothetical protein